MNFGIPLSGLAKDRPLEKQKSPIFRAFSSVERNRTSYIEGCVVLGIVSCVGIKMRLRNSEPQIYARLIAAGKVCHFRYRIMRGKMFAPHIS